MTTISPTSILQNKTDHVSTFLSTSAGVKISELSYFVYGSSVVHAVIESRKQKLKWQPEDLDLVFHIPDASFEGIISSMKSVKKIAVKKPKRFELNTYTKSVIDGEKSREEDLASVKISSYTLDYEVNLINDASWYNKSRSSFGDHLFRQIDLATLSCLYDPIENEIYVSELAKESIQANEIVLNPHFIRKFEFFLEKNVDVEDRTASPSFKVLQGMAIRTLHRVKKYKERGMKIGSETIEELKLIREFADEFK